MSEMTIHSALKQVDPDYSPAVVLLISKVRELIKPESEGGATDVVLSKVYQTSIEEGIRCVKDAGTKNMLEGRLAHIAEMIEVNGHSECAKEFRNVIEGQIAANSKISEKNLAQFLQCVTMHTMNVAKMVQ